MLSSRRERSRCNSENKSFRAHALANWNVIQRMMVNTAELSEMLFSQSLVSPDDWYYHKQWLEFAANTLSNEINWRVNIISGVPPVWVRIVTAVRALSPPQRQFSRNLCGVISISMANGKCGYGKDFFYFLLGCHLGFTRAWLRAEKHSIRSIEDVKWCQMH